MEITNRRQNHGLYITALFIDIDLEEVERNLVKRDNRIKHSWPRLNAGGAKPQGVIDRANSSTVTRKVSLPYTVIVRELDPSCSRNRVSFVNYLRVTASLV